MTDADCGVSEPELSIFEGRQEEKLFGRSHLSRAELVLLWLIAAISFITVVNYFQTYSAEVSGFGDNSAYVAAANGIQRWDFHGVQTKQSWGLSYLIAGLSCLHLSAQFSLLFICMAASIGSVLMVQNLWGMWIAAFFTILNFAWFQVSFLGGSEPLFVLLLFASFWLSRKERWLLASVLAALATLVRPVGLFALLAIGLALVLRRDYKKAFLCTAIAMLIGMLYLLPFWIYFHDPLYQFHRYKQADWQSGFVVSWPFHAIVLSFLHNREPWTNVIFTTGWLGFATLGLYRMSGKLYRRQIGEHANEYIFAISYLIFLFCYNSYHWARAEFPRFVIPVLPFLLLAFVRWLPKSRFVVYALCVVSSVLGACSAIGIRNVMAALR
jgi:hypothetical protein